MNFEFFEISCLLDLMFVFGCMMIKIVGKLE